jgi:hypothetical protein
LSGLPASAGIAGSAISSSVAMNLRIVVSLRRIDVSSLSAWPRSTLTIRNSLAPARRFAHPRGTPRLAREFCAIVCTKIRRIRPDRPAGRVRTA